MLRLTYYNSFNIKLLKYIRIIKVYKNNYDINCTVENLSNKNNMVQFISYVS